MTKPHRPLHPPWSVAVRTARFVFYCTLVPVLFYCTVANLGYQSNLKTTVTTSYVLPTISLPSEDNRYHRDPSGSAPPTFSDLEFIRLIGEGFVSWVFEARLEGRSVAAKIAADKNLFYSDIEIDIFDILKAPPSISNIPEVQLKIRSMPNPFSNQTFLKNDLGLSRKGAESLSSQRRVSVQAIDFLTNSRKPTTLQEFRIYLQSLLETLDFVHSRNIIHCDLHWDNVHFDGQKVSLFDWNGAFVFEPNKVLIHQPHAPKHLFPPEAQMNKSAVHATVSAFDIYTVGLLIKNYLRNVISSIDYNDKNDADAILMDLAEALARKAMTSDPFQRPNASQLLNQPFFVLDKNTIEKMMLQYIPTPAANLRV